MGRVWAVAGAFIGVLIVQLLLVGFVGSLTLKSALPVMALTVAVVFIPGNVVGKAVWLFVGSLIGMIGFLLGAGEFPDTNIGYFLGAFVPVVLVTIATMWQKKIVYWVAGVAGIAAFDAVYTTYFFSDPQSINFSMPIAYGIMIVPMALTFLAMVLLTELVPGLTTDAGKVSPSPAAPAATATDTDDAAEATDEAAAIEETSQLEAVSNSPEDNTKVGA